MQLVVDANILVAESLRIKGRQLLTHKNLKLITTSAAANETGHELRRRLRLMVARGRLQQPESVGLLAEAESIIADYEGVSQEHDYVGRFAEAELRIFRDPDDVPAVALALALDCGIWTSDRDFFGCGLPVWSTEVLQRYLESSPQTVDVDAPPE
jgi:predicted nucleic acid-binding protein